MAVTNKYDTFKKYSKEQINSFRDAANKIVLSTRWEGGKEADRSRWYYVNGKRVSQREYITARDRRSSLSTIVNDWTKQSADYYKAFGSSMLAGSNVGVDSASVSVNEVPVDRTDPILEATSTPKRKKRGDGSASALGL